MTMRMLFFIGLAGILAGVLLGRQESAVRPAEKPVPERETPAARSGVEARVSGQDFAGIPDLHSICYDDGDACPGGCDPHVVAHADTNGSARLHAPGSAAPEWKKCRVGADCEVCYGDDPQVGCILVRFRGSGPDIGRADYTAAWWARTCERDDLPATLARECRRIRDAATSLQAKQSCLADPTSAGCAGVAPGADAVAAAREAVRACLQSSGDSWRCYYKGTGGTLSQGTCRNGAVTESGWDCCTGDPVHDACVTGCKGFYR